MGLLMLRGGTHSFVCGLCALVASCDSELPELFPEGGSGGAAGSPNGDSRAGSGGARAGAAGAPNSSGSLGIAGILSVGGSPSSAGATSVDEAGAGGREPATCDDGDVCTEDATEPDGSCSHVPVLCQAADACMISACDTEAGGCVVAAVVDGSACDDGRSCTANDRCVRGMCLGSLPALTFREDTQTVVPDGLPDCAGPEDAVVASFETNATGDVGTVTVELDLEHPEFSELEIWLRHEPSGITTSIRSSGSATGVSVDGVYVFNDAGTLYPQELRDAPLDPGAYRPLESLSTGFVGTSAAGTWTLSIRDHCEGNTGTVRGFRIWIDVADC